MCNSRLDVNYPTYVECIRMINDSSRIHHLGVHRYSTSIAKWAACVAYNAKFTKYYNGFFNAIELNAYGEARKSMKHEFSMYAVRMRILRVHRIAVRCGQKNELGCPLYLHISSVYGVVSMCITETKS